MDKNNKHTAIIFTFLMKVIEGKAIRETNKDTDDKPKFTFPSLEQRLKASKILISKLDVFKNLIDKTEKSQHVQKLRSTLRAKLNKITKQKTKNTTD